MTERDSRRARVYEAESLVRRLLDRAESSANRTLTLHGSTLTLPAERRFASVESMQRYVDLVLGLNWVRSAWPDRSRQRVTVRERNGQARAHYERLTATIAIPPHVRNRAWAMRELVVLHELAHHLAPDGRAAPHGVEFVERFVNLVDGIIGPETALLLRTAMHDNGALPGGPRSMTLGM